MMPNMLDRMGDDFTIMDKITRPPGPMGGGGTDWVEGAPVKILMEVSSDTESIIAQRKDKIVIYACHADKFAPIGRGTILRRNSDGETFKVNTDPGETKTPAMSNLNLKYFTVEQWDIPPG